MRLLHPCTPCLICLASSPACGDDGGPAADGSDGHGSAGSSADGSTHGDATAGGCAAAASRSLLADHPRGLTGLSVVDGGDLVALSVAVGTPTQVVRVDGQDGGATTLFESQGDRRIESLIAAGDTIYYLERDNADPLGAAELFTLPIAGGTPTRVGDVGFDVGRLFAVADGYVYNWRDTDQPVAAVFERVDVAAAAIERIATTADGTGTPFHVTLSGDTIFFMQGFAGAGASEPVHVYAMAKDADDVAPDDLFQAPTDDPCFGPLGGLFATPTKLACGYADVFVRDRDGGNPTALLESMSLDPGYLLGAADGENLYVLQVIAPGGAQDGRIVRIASSGGELVDIACDVGPIGNPLIDGFFPDQTEYEIAFGDTEMFWIEAGNDDAGNPRYAVRAATK